MKLEININEIKFSKLDGIVPAVVVDRRNNQILMLGFMNKEALEETIKTKLVTFFSRTRNEIWVKGKTSGNYLRLAEIIPDCDDDSLIVYAFPDGPTCHTGSYSCFELEDIKPINFLNDLFSLIKKRKTELPEGSYTTKLFKEGENRIIQKVGEEAIETVIAAKNQDKNEIINETSDLIYHLFVMLVQEGVEFSEVVDNLERRYTKKNND